MEAQNKVMEGAEVSQAELIAVSKPLRDLEPILGDPDLRSIRKDVKLIPNFPQKRNLPVLNDMALPQGNDPLAQSSYKANGGPIIPSVDVNGLGYTNVAPPDPSGEIGRDYYIQMINAGAGARFRISDRNGETVFGPSTLQSFWDEFGLQGAGDPIVLYDEHAKRWILTEFAPQGADHFMMVVSATSDPLGSWYAYRFQAPSFPDYPKYGIWSDGLYVTTNEGFDPNIPVYIINKEQMYSGAANADVQRMGFPKVGQADTWQVATPADWDGRLAPPPGAPGMILRLRDDAWGFNAGQDRIQIYNFHIDWDDPDNSFVDSPVNLNTVPFNSNVCASFGNCVDQPGAENIDALEGTIMNKVQYRRFADYEALVLCHPVNVINNGFRAGIRWYEMRKYPNGGWEIHQEGTHAPDSKNRIIPTIAMDGAGSIALGYGITDASTFPGIGLTGRRASDPLGVMTCDETILNAGQSANDFNRFGDYFHMSVDPLSENEFWFTGEYFGFSNWRTSIAAFPVYKDAFDVGVSRLVNPFGITGNNETASLTVEISNYGNEQASNISVGYEFDGEVISENFEGTLNPGESAQYTFSNTANLGEVGDYEFKFFTDWSSDQARFNDTINEVLKVREAFDANVLAIEGLNADACSSEKTVQVLVKNDGAYPLSTLNVSFKLNSGVVQSFIWTGSIDPLETGQIEIALTNLEEGENRLFVFTSLPNGQPDGVFGNDNISETFYAYFNQGDIRIEIKTDQYPNETTWILEDGDSGEVLATGGPYSSTNFTYVEEVCASVRCFRFVLQDSYGDGMNSGAPGDFSIFGPDGTELAGLINPNFGSQVERNICIDVDCNLTHSGSATGVTAGGANDGTIILEAEGGLGPFEYSINSGASYQESPVFEGLSAGEYETRIRDNFDCVAGGTVNVESFAGIGDFEEGQAQVILSPNPTPGIFKIEVHGLADAQDLEIQIFNQAGQEIMQKVLANWSGVHMATVGMINRPAGLYFIRVQHGTYNRLVKLILE